MAFDPDAYLATEDKKKGFDPDAYLATQNKTTGFDPDAYLARPTTTARKEQGKAFASLADTALNTITGGLDMAAYPLARLYYGTVGGLPAEQAAAKAQAETTSPKDVVGRAFGYTGQPSYENSPFRQTGEYIGQVLGENVIAPAAQATGLPEPDVANMVNWGTLGVAGPAGRVVKSTANTAGNVAKGALGSGFGYIARPGIEPKGYQVPSARTKLGNDFVEPKSYEAYQRGEIPIEEMGNYPHTKPIQELPQNVLERTALQLGGGTMPFKGQAAQAFGERLGETYRNPVTAAIDLGSAAFTGIPFYTAGKTALGGVRAAGDYLMSRKGFDPMLPENLKFAREAQQTIEGMGGVSGPVSPGGMATPTPAAQAAMATTQRVAGTPKPQSQPRPQAQPFTLPDAGTHYNMAAQGSANFADTFNKAVSARTQDLLKNAKQTGQKLTPEQAGNLAFDEIKEWRRNNVDAFKPTDTPEPTAATSPEEVLADFKPPKVDPELQMDQGIWKRLQDKTASGTPLEVNEQTAVRRITNKYGQDPFQTGNIKGEAVLETPKRKNVKQETRVKEMEAERTKDMTPEQIAADEQAMMDRVKRMADPNSKLNKTLRGDLGSVKTTPKVETPALKPELKKGETLTINDDDFDAPRFTGIEKELLNKIPKKTEWVKEIRYMNANDDIAVSEYYSKATKNQPEYKFVDKFINEGDDLSELYVKKGNDWELVGDEKTIIGAREAASKAEYEQKMKAYYEPIRQEINMTLDEFMALPHDKLIELGKQVKKAKGKPPKDAMEMKTGGKQFDSKADYEAQVLLDRLADKPTTGSFVDNGMRYEITAIDYGTTPRKVLEGLNKPLTQVRVFSEKTNNQISGPAPDVPEKSLRQRIEEQRKRK
jgi:hypothetical protein